MANLKNLFGINSANNANSDNVATSQSNTQSADAKRSGETYVAYGKRVCGLSNGSPLCLSPFLQRIFTSEKQKQLDDTVFQESERQKKIQALAQLEGKVTEKSSEVDLIDNKIHQAEEKANEYKDEIESLKSSAGTVNKNARVKFVIGCVILLIMTVYLFIFYSSTFYSAFFKDFLESGTITLNQAIFDSAAIPKSLEAGFGQMLFVLSAPIIFLGLGFALHYFSQEAGKAKIFKILAIIIVTFIFDCILAYGIALKMYNILAMQSLEELPPYTLREAFDDSNVWAVIFCGFVVYIIWGIVFSMTMTAFENLRSNKGDIAVLKSKLSHLTEKIHKLKADKIILVNDLKNMEKEIESQRQQLEANVTIKYADIKVALNDFFTGWTSLLVPLGKSDVEIANTNDVYKQNINTLIPTNEKG